MVDRMLRPHKERVLKPFAIGLKRVSPSAVTLAGLILGLGAAGALFINLPLLAFGLWLANRTLDGLDGEIARLTEQQSDWGGYLDIMVDFIVYAAIPLAIAARAPTPFVMLSAIGMLAVYYVNTASWMYLAALLEKRGRGGAALGERTSITMPPGLIEGAETIVVYGFFCLLPAYAPYLFIIMSVLLSVTVGQRLAWAHKHLR